MDSRIKSANDGFYYKSNIYVIAGQRPGNPIEPAVDGKRSLSSASGFCRSPMAVNGFKQRPQV
jgi:hypothetical protein